MLSSSSEEMLEILDFQGADYLSGVSSDAWQEIQRMLPPTESWRERWSKERTDTPSWYPDSDLYRASSL